VPDIVGEGVSRVCGFVNSFYPSYFVPCTPELSRWPLVSLHAVLPLLSLFLSLTYYFMPPFSHSLAFLKFPILFRFHSYSLLQFAFHCH